MEAMASPEAVVPCGAQCPGLTGAVEYLWYKTLSVIFSLRPLGQGRQRIVL